MDMDTHLLVIHSQLEHCLTAAALWQHCLEDRAVWPEGGVSLTQRELLGAGCT